MLDVKFNYVSSFLKGDFNSTFIDAFSKLNINDNLLKMSVFADSYSCEGYVKNLNFIKEVVKSKFGPDAIEISYIAQKPLDAELILEFVHAEKESNVFYNSHNGITYAKVEEGDKKMIFISGICGEINQLISKQSRLIFQSIDEILKFEDMPISSIVRQWNFIPGITMFENDFQHYQQFNDIRALFYEKTKWNKGYPSATGIGTKNAPLLVDVIAMKGHNGEIPIRNSKQIDAHIYSDEVLLGAEDQALKQRYTPKFERAKLIIENTKALVFVSGTAAIIGEESLGQNNVKDQTNITIDHINNLVTKEVLNSIEFKSKAQFESIRVYVKHISDYEVVKQVCEKRLPNVNVVYVEADVCRDELLVEIEAFVKIKI